MAVEYDDFKRELGRKWYSHVRYLHVGTTRNYPTDTSRNSNLIRWLVPELRMHATEVK